MKIKEILKGLFQPGYIWPTARAFYLFLFFVITISQTYCSLLMEEQLAIEDKYPNEIPEEFKYNKVSDDGYGVL